ncbi:hypothetical protein QE152_g21611 [Popillia japonica]|uniref:Uncharacterized protein n=1 Tax=Popillia japonica TaxID=7064 RepID=A0AAW1KP31_POPJA
MEARIVFACLIAVVLCQVIIAGVPSLRERRETATDSSKTISDMLDSIKTGFDDLVKNVQSNELVRNATQALSGFAQSVEAQGKELIEKMKQPSQ